MYEADALTWRFYHIHASLVAHAINNTAYGDAPGRALCARPFSERPEEEAHSKRRQARIGQRLGCY